MTRLLVLMMGLLLSLATNSFAYGECDGRARPLSLTVTNDGTYVLQTLSYDTFADVAEALQRFGESDCMVLNIAGAAPGKSVAEALSSLGVTGSIKTSNTFLGAGGTGSVVPALIWVRNGYQGKVN